MSLKLCLRIPGLVAVLTLAACASESQLTPAATRIEPIQSPTSLPVAQQPTTTLTPQPVPIGPLDLVVWWPEPLAPVGSREAEDLLAAQIEAFESSVGGIRIERRLKKVSEAGGILSTLRSASIVAPGALPDLTLLRREDLLTAAEAGLIQPLDQSALSATIGSLADLSATTVELGSVGEQLYGVPYMLEILHTAYRSDTPIDSWDFQDVLERRVPFVFPVGRGSPFSPTFYVQYLAAGGRLPQSGGATLNSDALRTVLDFYAQARVAGLIDSAVLDYTSPEDYLPAMVGGQIDVGVVNSTLYLQMRAEGHDLRAAPLPTATGRSATLLNGWAWVIVTSNADRQAMALRFINWMMDADRQGQYAAAVYMLPSQRAAFRSWEDEDLDLEMISGALENAVLPLGPDDGGSLARAMQNALLVVLAGERTAEQATQDVIDQEEG